MSHSPDATSPRTIDLRIELFGTRTLTGVELRLIRHAEALEQELADERRKREIAEGLERMAFDQRDKAWEDAKAQPSETVPSVPATMLQEACCIALAISGHFCENPDEWLRGHEKRLRELEKIAKGVMPSAIAAPAWIPVTERLPEGHGEVLVAHPCLSNVASQMFGVAVRAESTVRKWMSDPSDDSMHNAFWMPMPKGPA